MRVLMWARFIAIAATAAVVSAGFSAPASAQQNAAIRGTITDATTGAPVLGAQVVVAGTRRSTQTDAAGRFLLPDLAPGIVTLRVQHIAYVPAEERVTLAEGQTAVVEITVTSTAIALDELVVVGYGTRARRSLSTSVASVQAQEIENTPLAGIDAMLQGRAPGLQIVQNAGNPGNGITVRIRGSSSISASNQPLWVVDGVPVLSDQYSQLGVGGQNVNVVTNLNPDEIESIDVLKDAAAAAIYGSRASNGVVLVTTRRGRVNQPPQMTFSAYTGVQQLAKKVEVLNAQEYVDYFKEAAENDDDWPPFDIADYPYNTDWQDALFRNAAVRNVNVGVSGGSDRIQYYASGSFFNQEGIALGTEYDRTALRMNLDFDGTRRLTFRTSVGLVHEVNQRIETDNSINGVVTNALANAPIFPVRQPDGSFTSTADGLEYTNSIALATLNSIETRTIRALGSVDAVLDLGQGLVLNSKIGLDVLNVRDLRYDSPDVIGTYAASAGGIARQGNNTVDRLLVESYMRYDRTLGHSGALGLTGGASVEYNREEWDWLRGEGFPSPQFRFAGNAGTITDYDAGRQDYNLVSFFSRASYDLLSRYFLTASVRMDGSSRFGRDNRYAVFPAASVGWAIGDEVFMDWLRPVGDLRLRLSYGETGNQSIHDNYAALGRYGRANYGGEPGIAPISLENPNLKWETTRELDAGIDLDALDGRISFSADYYVKRTNDLLISRPIPATSGHTSIWDNVGNIENRGFEFGLQTVNLRPSNADGLSWTSSFNIAFNRNRITALHDDEPFSAGLRGVNRVQVGAPIGAFFMIRFLGVDPATGDAIFDDVNDDGRINDDDRVIVGSPHPDFFGGLGNTFSWRNLELRSFLQFAVGHDIFNGNRIFADDGGYYFDNKLRSVLRRWQNPGDITDVPRASYWGTSGARTVSSRMLEDGSYLRIHEIRLSYRLPPSFARGIQLNSGSVFFAVNNVHTFTKYSGYSPDVNYAGSSTNITLGTDFYTYPIPRSFSIGLSGVL